MAGPEEEGAGDGCGGCGEGGPPAARLAIGRGGLQAAGIDGGLLQQACMLIDELQVEAACLPVGAQQSFELSMLLGCDLAIDGGVDEGFEIHARPSV